MRRYKLYSAKLPLEVLEYGLQSLFKEHLAEIEDTLAERQRNPLFVLWVGGRYVVQVGKHRCHAAERLEIPTLECLIVSYDGGSLEALKLYDKKAKEVEPEEAWELFDKDYYTEHSDRFFAVKYGGPPHGK